MKPDYLQLDQEDLLASIRQQFLLPANTIYLDGNSLGALPKAVKQRVAEVTEQQWGQDLIASWNRHDWIGLSSRVGDKLGKLIGAEPGQTVCADSISVNLFKALSMALQLCAPKRQVLTTADNFPTDIYMVEGLQDLLGRSRCELITCEEASLLDRINEETAVVMFTLVNFRTGRILPIRDIMAKAKQVGAKVIVDLAHSAGIMPLHLDSWDVDFAVGCTYKYLNGGPGAPGFIYANRKHHGDMQQPLYGWMGHASAFTFDMAYQPAKDATQMLVGTPPVISMSAVDAALDVFNNVNLAQIRHKSMQLGSFFLTCMQNYPACEALRCISPSSPEQRGSQLSFAFEHAYALCQSLIDRGVIADFRAPNYIRFGFAPLYNSFEDIAKAVDTMNDVLESGDYQDAKYQVRNKVT